MRGLSTRVRAGILAVILTGCAAQEYIRQGDRLQARGRYEAAIEKYEEALAIEPENAAAEAGVRQARRSAVREQLERAEAALEQRDYAEALTIATRTQQMPLDLEAVELVRRIDAVIDEATSGAKDEAESLIEQGHFMPAVTLSRRIIKAAPPSAQRRRWAESLQQRAIEHYLGAAEQYARAELPGAAAVQLAMAKHMGAENVRPQQVGALWDRFAEPTCFQEPEVAVTDASGQAKQLLPRVKQAARRALNRLQERCGQGSRPLGVEIVLKQVSIDADETTERAAEPLPGFDVKTEEVYYVKEPYTVVEEVTEYETRTEVVTRRDCAPRPGKKERGCRTWTEEIEKKVPVRREKEVTKYRKVEKTRPVKGPLPQDKVVTYEVRRVVREVVAAGRIRIDGGDQLEAQEQSFEITERSSDATHPRVKGGTGPRELVIPEDPLKVASMPELLVGAAESISEKLQASVQAAVRKWSSRYRKTAEQQNLQGQLPQAEELYLKMLALGASDDSELANFFERRYGAPVEDVMRVLARGLGRRAQRQDAGATGSKKTRRTGMLPRREPSGPSQQEQKAGLDAFVPEARGTQGSDSAKPDAPEAERTTEASVPARTAQEEAELDALEAASLEAAGESTQEGKATPASDGASAASASETEDAASATPSDAQDAASTTPSDAEDAASAAPSDAEDAASETPSDAEDAASTTPSDAEDAASATPSDAEDAASATPSDAQDAASTTGAQAASSASGAEASSSDAASRNGGAAESDAKKQSDAAADKASEVPAEQQNAASEQKQQDKEGAAEDARESTQDADADSDTDAAKSKRPAEKDEGEDTERSDDS